MWFYDPATYQISCRKDPGIIRIDFQTVCISKSLFRAYSLLRINESMSDDVWLFLETFYCGNTSIVSCLGLPLLTEIKWDFSMDKYSHPLLYMWCNHSYMPELWWWFSSALWILMAWCFSTRALVATVLTKPPSKLGHGWAITSHNFM